MKETYLVRSRFCASVKTSQFFPDVIWKFKALDAGAWAGHFWLKFAMGPSGTPALWDIPGNARTWSHCGWTNPRD